MGSVRMWLAGLAGALALSGLAIAPTAATTTAAAATTAALGRALVPAAAPAAVKGFDEAGPSTGTGDSFTAANWVSIKDNGFKLFITDPIEYSSECSDGDCTAPVNTCTIYPAAVTQIQRAYNEGIDYAVYTRNVNCLTAAIEGLSSTLQAHLSFAVLDIETDPSVPLTSSLVNGVTALGQTPVIYSYQSAWESPSLMDNTTAYDQDCLHDGEVPNWNVAYPAPDPPGWPALVSMPNPYGGWSGYDAQIEQQQTNAEVDGVDNSTTDSADLDAVNAAWLASLPHQAP